MAAYNRRWYILSFLAGLIGVGLIATSLGTDSFIIMNIPRDDGSDDSVTRRHLGFVIGSDYVTLAFRVSDTETPYKNWPVACGDVEKECDQSTLLDPDRILGYPRMCDCVVTVTDGVQDKQIVPVYSTALWWTTVGFSICSILVGLYASIIAGYNGVTKPTQEFLSVRAVLYSFVTAIVLVTVAVILAVVIYFTEFRSETVIAGKSMNCPLPTGSTFSQPAQIPTAIQEYKCEDAKLGMSFYFQIIAIVMWILSILFGFKSQHGFESIDDNSKFETEKTKDEKNTNVESMMF